jgi:branched-chain amino acid transport system substrate-binding protein
VYLLWDEDTEYTRLLAQYFEQRWTTLAGAESILLEDTYHFQDTDFGDQITRLQALPQPPDFLYISAMPDDIGKIVKQIRAAGIESLIVGGDGYDTPQLIEDAGQAAENVYFTTHALVTAENTAAAMQEFMRKYQDTYGVAPENAFAVLGYDALKLLADAIERAGTTDAQAIIQALEETQDFAGITGAISFAPGVHIPRKGVTIIAVRNGRFTLATEVVPEQIPPAE